MSEMETLRSLNQLPQDCLAHVISRTTPCDACVSSAVSSNFRSVVDSDDLWKHFLPSDYNSLLSHAVVPVQYASWRELYFKLCDHPVPIYGGNMVFGLYKSSGAKWFAISAREMNASLINCKKYWKWVRLTHSRFSKGLRFNSCGFFNALTVSGTIASTMLSSETAYAAYLIFRDAEKYWMTDYSLLQSTVEIGRVKVPSGAVALHPKDMRKSGLKSLHLLRRDIEWPKDRTDGWKEVKMGEFYIKNGVDKMVKIKLQKPHGVEIPGMIILGMEIRPKGS